MNRKIVNSAIGVFTVFIFFCFLIFLLVITFINNLMLGIVLLIIFYLFNFVFCFDLFTKTRIDARNKKVWMIIFSLFPGIGGVAYYLAGYVPKKNKEHLERLFLLEADLAKEPSYTITKTDDPLFKKDYNLQNRQVITNSKIDFLNGGYQKFKELFIDLEMAKEFIHIEYFILYDGILWNKLKNLLIKKQKEGVKIKLLIDYIGCLRTSKTIFEDLGNYNIKFAEFNKSKFYIKSGFLNYRIHNKFVIIDNKIAYLGGINIGDDYIGLYPKYGNWFDLQTRCEGEIVNELNNHFIAQWYLSTKKMIKSSPVYSVDNDLKMQFFADGPNISKPIFVDYFLDLLRNAKKEVKIVAPYLVFPKYIHLEIKKAISRGIDIEIITIDRWDKFLAYQSGKIHIRKLIDSGVKIYRTANVFIHSKIYIFDDQYSIVGSSNLDYRSLFLHFESNLLIKNEQKNQELREIFELYKKNSFLEKKQHNSITNNLKKIVFFFLDPIL